MDLSTKFRNSSGARYLKGLFFETSDSKDTVLYTLKDRDHLGYPSMYRLYIEAADLLEITFAETYLDGYEHFQMLCNCTWFEPYISRWRLELELKIRAEALARTIQDARSDSKSAAQSRKFLLERGWVPKSKKGRPSKEQVKAEAKRLAEATKDFQSDLSRIQPVPGAIN